MHTINQSMMLHLEAPDWSRSLHRQHQDKSHSKRHACPRPRKNSTWHADLALGTAQLVRYCRTAGDLTPTAHALCTNETIQWRSTTRDAAQNQPITKQARIWIAGNRCWNKITASTHAPPSLSAVHPQLPSSQRHPRRTNCIPCTLCIVSCSSCLLRSTLHTC